jgi:hypothetical protein
MATWVSRMLTSAVDGVRYAAVPVPPSQPRRPGTFHGVDLGDGPAVRLPVPHPLPAGLRPVCGGGAAHGAVRRAGPPGGLPPPPRDSPAVHGNLEVLVQVPTDTKVSSGAAQNVEGSPVREAGQLGEGGQAGVEFPGESVQG